MNPAIQIQQKIQAVSTPTGTIIDQTSAGFRVKLSSGGEQSWALQPNLTIGDNVLISNGRLLKSPPLKITEVYVV